MLANCQGKGCGVLPVLLDLYTMMNKKYDNDDNCTMTLDRCVTLTAKKEQQE